MIDTKKRMGNIHFSLGKTVGENDYDPYPTPMAKILQFTVTISHTNRTNVIAFSESR
jgi:hypothetical protein